MNWQPMLPGAEISDCGKYRVVLDKSDPSGLRHLAYRGSDDPEAASECLGWYSSAALAKARCERDADGQEMARTQR